MAIIGSTGDVTVRVGTQYDDEGTAAAKKGAKSAGQKIKQTWEKLEEAQKKLGITTQREKMQMVQAYKTLKASGVASSNDLRRAQERLNETLGKSPSLLARLKSSWLSIVAVLFAVKKAWDLAGEAAQIQQQKTAFENLAESHNVNSNKIIASLKALSGRTLDTASIMKSAGAAMLLGIPADRLSRMMEIARASARVMGTSVKTAFDDIAKGIGRQSPLILDNLGITVKLSKAYADYARQQNITVAAMTDSQRKQAFLNAAMESGEDIIRRVGVQGATSAEKMAMLTVKMQELKLWVGKLVVGPLLKMAELLGIINTHEKNSRLDSLNTRIALMEKSTATLKESGRFAVTLRIQEEKLNDLYRIRKQLIEDTKAAEAKAAVRKKEIDPVADEALKKALQEEAKLIGPHDVHLQSYYDMISKKIEANRQYFEELNEMTVQSDLTETERENLRHQRLMEKLQNDLIFLTDANMMTEELEAGFRLAKEQAVMLHEQNMTKIQAEEDAKRKKLTESVANHEKSVKQNIASMTISLLRSLGGKNKAFAIAAIALEKGLAMGRAAMHTAVAVMHATALDPSGITGMAARVALLGKIQLGLIAATGLAQAASVGGGGAGAGSPGGPPVQTESADSQSAGNLLESGAQQQPTVVQRTYINVEGHVVDLADFARKLIPSLEEATEDGV